MLISFRRRANLEPNVQPLKRILRHLLMENVAVRGDKLTHTDTLTNIPENKS